MALQEISHVFKGTNKTMTLTFLIWKIQVVDIDPFNMSKMGCIPYISPPIESTTALRQHC